MTDNLGLDGSLERYSRGLDTWVPLDSEASFAAMKRSIDVQRRSGGNHRARVLLRIKSPNKTEQDQKPESAAATATVMQPPLLPIIPAPLIGLNTAPLQPSDDTRRLSFRPFVPAPLERTKGSQGVQGPPFPPPPPPFQPLQPQNLPGPSQIFFQPPPPPPAPSGMAVPPPPPPPPPPQFPFDQHRPRFFPPPHHHMHPPPGFAPQSMPLPPLVPERPPMLRTAQIDRPAVPSIVTEQSDADMVLSILGELEEKMQFVGDKVDQIQLEEKKHYESLRRGLRRLKEDKLTGSVGPNADGDYPCCICNYCLKRTYPLVSY
jgi:hypothetical protein